MLALATAPHALLAKPEELESWHENRANQSWNDMLEQLRDLPNRVLEKLPDDQQRDPLVQLEAAPLALGSLTSFGLSALGADPDHPSFLPLNTDVLRNGQPAADTIYKTAFIAPGGTYRITGKRGSVRMAILAQRGPMPGGPAQTQQSAPQPSNSHLDLDDLTVDDADRFSVVLSPERPDGYQGDWWELEPGTVRIMARLMSSDWASETDPSLAIERLDGPVRKPRPATTDLEDIFERVAVGANFSAPLLVRDPEKWREAGAINTFAQHTQNRGFVPGQYYYIGAFDIEDDEALLIEVTIPSSCTYWSVMLTDHLYVTIDPANNQSSLNDSQAVPDPDGKVRILISHKDPGFANWIDPAGYSTGLIQGRWLECDENPSPSLRKIAFEDVPEVMPEGSLRISSEQREEALRSRRSAREERPLW